MKEKGKMYLKGTGLEDVVGNLMRNGYSVKIEADSNDNPLDAIFKLTYKADDMKFLEDMDLPFI